MEQCFGRIFLGEIFWEEFLGGILCLHCKSQLSFLNMEGIDLDFCRDFARKDKNLDP